MQIISTSSLYIYIRTSQYLLVVVVVTVLRIFYEFFDGPMFNECTSTQILDVFGLFALVFRHEYVEKVFTVYANQLHVAERCNRGCSSRGIDEGKLLFFRLFKKKF